MTETEYLAYHRVHELVINALPRPNLLLYLDTPVPVLYERIQARGREMEKTITVEYLELLDHFYREWLAGFDLCPVLTIPTHNLNFAVNEKHIAIIIERIRQKLAGKEEVVFPDDL